MTVNDSEKKMREFGKAWQMGREFGGRGGGTTLSRVDGDDLAPAAADQEDPVEALREDLQELHILEGKG